MTNVTKLFLYFFVLVLFSCSENASDTPNVSEPLTEKKMDLDTTFGVYEIRGKFYSAQDLLEGAGISPSDTNKRVLQLRYPFPREEKRINRMFLYNSIFTRYSINMNDLDFSLHPIMLAEDIPSLSPEEREKMGMEVYTELCYRNMFNRFRKKYPGIVNEILDVFAKDSFVTSNEAMGQYHWAYDEIYINVDDFKTKWHELTHMLDWRVRFKEEIKYDVVLNEFITQYNTTILLLSFGKQRIIVDDRFYESFFVILQNTALNVQEPKHSPETAHLFLKNQKIRKNLEKIFK